ncbi:MAG TPA: orotidine-5'-phosphate decarboxylase [Acidimicrobiales bacterium]|jgi:orotidine-5'-phosphate decarboxylase|nr:orotidine-5'-phosphate decarboxylase [Acidimicrobiales bacterium]
MTDGLFQRLSKAVVAHGPLCVGLDPSPELLSAWGLTDDATSTERLARTAIAATQGVAGIVKVQVAFFERHGAAGYAGLERVIAEARAAGLIVIADAKRGDIRSTNEGYAEAWLSDDSPLAADALTVSCYLGIDAMTPMFELAHATGRGVFAVAASSNDEGRGLQTARFASGATVESELLGALDAADARLGGSGAAPRCLGAVVGAQRRPEGLGAFEGPVLVPGIGAQGSGPSEVAELRTVMAHDVMAVTVSRAILGAGPSPVALRETISRLAGELR